MTTWDSPCDYGPIGSTCGKTASVVEKGSPRCRAHTALKLKAIAEKGKLVIAKSERRQKAAERQEKATEKWFAAISRGAKELRKQEKPDLFVGISGRKRAFHLCQLCGRDTESGKPEKAPELRYCRLHMPANVALKRTELLDGMAKRALSKTNGSRFRGCRATAYAKVASSVSSESRCATTSTRCWDESRRWEVARVRCRTKLLDRRGSTQAQAPRREDRAPSP